MKTRIADGDDFVDQETIELDDHRKGKGEPRAHSGGIGFHRFPQENAKLRKFLDEPGLVFGVDAVDPADEPQIVIARQGTLECSAKSQRPGHAHVAMDVTASREFGAADQAYEGGFSGTIAAKDADPLPLVHRQIQPTQNLDWPAARRISFGNAG